MPRPTKLNEHWLEEVVEVMVRQGCGLRDAVTQLQIEVSSQEVENVLRRKGFQKLLQETKHRYHQELGSDPQFNQDVVVGRLIVLAQKLQEQGDLDKAGEVWLKLAKIKGWVGPESQVSVFGELSQRDLDSIRESLSSQPKHPILPS